MIIIRSVIVISGLYLFLLTNVFGQQKAGEITVSGQIKHTSNQVEIEDMSEFQYLLPPKSERIVIPDANGKFIIKFKAVSANYYRLGRNALYLRPGDNLQVFIDGDNPGLATFKGRSAAANTYLKGTPFPKGASFLEGGSQLKTSPSETIAAVEDKASQRRKELTLLKNVDQEFRRLEAARIKADLINSMYGAEIYTVILHKLKSDQAKAAGDAYKKITGPKIKVLSKNFTDASLMKLVVYRDIADEVIKWGGDGTAVQKIRDWYAVRNLVDSMEKVSDKQKLAGLKKDIARIKTVGYRNAANQMLAYLMAFGKGDPAVDFVVVDLSGKNINLSSLKGKVIFIDIWATWCGPCMEEMPYFEKLKTAYKDNPNVVFVSLSIDDGDIQWKENVKIRNAEGYQWRINRNKLKAYNIVNIPRTLIIDKDFKIADIHGPMPSEPKAASVIDELLK